MVIRIQAEKNKSDKRPKATTGPATEVCPWRWRRAFSVVTLAQTPGGLALLGTVSRPPRAPGGLQENRPPVTAPHASPLGHGPHGSEILVGTWAARSGG